MLTKNESDDYILKHAETIYVDYETLYNHTDFLFRVISLLQKNNSKLEISCENYACLEIIDKYLKERMPLTIMLDDDFENRDRSYIDTRKFDKFAVSLPLTYLMWNANFPNTTQVNMFKLLNNLTPANGNKTLSKDTLLQIKEIVLKLQEIGAEDDLQKIILISNYLQRNVQYVSGTESEASDGIYIVSSPLSSDKLDTNAGLIETVINENYGLCMGIANTTTVLLNNPILNINVRSMFGCSHVWNIVKVNNTFYYMDNTWNITRNDNRLYEALKAKSFSHKYLLLGRKCSEEIGHHIPENSNINIPNLSQSNYSPEEIEKAKHVLSRKISFTYPDKLAFPSHKK